ncbi:hypothetical protein MCEMSE15_01592 [Fimbriimonadaceae bacterium]
MKLQASLSLLALFAASAHAQYDPNTVLTKAIADLLYEPKGVSTRTTYSAPANWPGSWGNFTVFETGSGSFTTDLNPLSLRPPDAHTYTVYYVDPIAGSDQNSGSTKQSALRKLSLAVSKPGNKWILCRPGVFDFRTCWGGVSSVGNVVIEPWDESGYVISSSQMDNLAWQPDSGIFTSVISTSAVQVIDEQSSDVYGVGSSLIKVTSVAAVRSTPGSFYSESKRVWVNRSNGAAPDGQLLLFASAQNGAMQNGQVWLRRCVFLGGSNTFTASLPADSELTFSDCWFKYATSGDGLAVSGPGKVNSLFCWSLGNRDDGFDYRGGLRFLDVANVSVANGTQGAKESSGLAAFDATTGIVVNGIYRSNFGPNVTATSNSSLLLFGSTIGQSRASGSSAVDLRIGQGASDASQGWALGISYDAGSTYCRSVAPISTIWYRKHRDLRPDILGAQNRIRPI